MFASTVNIVYIKVDAAGRTNDSECSEETSLNAKKKTMKKTAVRSKIEGSYHHGNLKTSLKQAALRLVRKKGARGFSINEASRLAGVTVAAPYRHFADKDALLAEIASDGWELLDRELRDAASEVEDIREKLVEIGMTYVRFSKVHLDYFEVMFYAGLDKSKYPNLESSGRRAFAVLSELAEQLEQTPQLAQQRAVTCWALVHGLAALTVEGALSSMMSEDPEFEHLRPLFEQFLSQPCRSADRATMPRQSI